jgi:hypothetical protein
LPVSDLYKRGIEQPETTQSRHQVFKKKTPKSRLTSNSNMSPLEIGRNIEEQIPVVFQARIEASF